MSTESQPKTLYFYQGTHLVSITQGDSTHTIFRNADIPLAENRIEQSGASSLLGSDLSHSVIATQDKSGDGEDGHR